RRIIVTCFRTSLAAEQPSQRWTQHIFSRFHGMAGLALPEDLPARGSVAVICLGHSLGLSGGLSTRRRTRGAFVANRRWRLRRHSRTWLLRDFLRRRGRRDWFVRGCGLFVLMRVCLRRRRSSGLASGRRGWALGRRRTRLRRDLRRRRTRLPLHFVA